MAEASAVPLRGWDFSWLRGRASGSDPSWSYAERAAALLPGRAALLDIDTGGGEMLAALGPRPPVTIATEGWEPNVAVARERLGPLGVDVRHAPDADLPVPAGAVDLVLNRHGRLDAGEVARVLRPGGDLLTQQVGAEDCAELNAALGAPPPYGRAWSADVAAAALTAAGLTVTDVREERPELVFHDIGALVYQLRAVPWQVRDFTVTRYEPALRRIDERIRGEGAFAVRTHRFLVQARVL